MFDTLSQNFEDCKDSLPAYKNHVQSSLSITASIGEYILEFGHDKLTTQQRMALEEIQRDVKICQSRLSCLHRKFTVCDAAILRAIVLRAKKGHDKKVWQAHAISCYEMFLKWMDDRLEFANYFCKCVDKWEGIEHQILESMEK
jgi:hypothetical protein